MKQIFLVAIICIFSLSVSGCEKADDALKILDKATTLKADIEKKTKDVKDKVQGLLPASMGAEKKDKDNGQADKGSKDKDKGKEAAESDQRPLRQH